MDILEQDYPDETHVFVYDNAKTHTAQAQNALSTRKMPVDPNKDFGYFSEKDKNGKLTRRRMGDGQFPGGKPQFLYFPANHQLAGQFKGMRVLIQEHIKE
ncbi:hypothetical protein PQX77_018315, partial [Marasmius sp. AFHP31]